MNDLIYGIKDNPKTFKELLLYSIQQVLSVFVATILIANICGTPISSCLIGAGMGTIIYQIVTKGSSPMFISSCGATCSAVIGALALGNGGNYLYVLVGGFVILIVYTLFALFIKKQGIDKFNNLFPPTVIGSTTLIIGLNLAKFIPTYVNLEKDSVGMLIALFTLAVVVIITNKAKGFSKTIALLFGLVAGYMLCVILTVTNIYPIIDFTPIKECKSVFMSPDYAYLYCRLDDFTLGNAIKAVALFLPVTICAVFEHYSDHKVLSNIIGTDLTKTPGIHRTLIGDGLASLYGTFCCGLPNTSYGESIATIGMSKVASVNVTRGAALIMVLASFLAPVQAILQTIPSCVFGGCAILLYGYISSSGLQVLLSDKDCFKDERNTIIVCVMLSIGISGVFLFDTALSETALALLIGVVLNLIMKRSASNG